MYFHASLMGKSVPNYLYGSLWVHALDPGDEDWGRRLQRHMYVCWLLIDGHSLQLARDTMLWFLFYCASWWFLCANESRMTLATLTNIDESGILEFYGAHESRTSSNVLSSSMRWTPRNKCSFSPHTSKTQAMVIPLPNVKNMWQNLQYLGISVSCNIRYDGSMTQQPMSTPKNHNEKFCSIEVSPNATLSASAGW